MSPVSISLWKRIKLRHKFTIVAILFTGVLGGLISFNATLLNSQKQSNELAEIAGRQRVLIQRYMVDVLLAAQGQPDRRQETARVLQDSIAALGEAGATPTIEIRAKLAEQGEQVRKMIADATRVLSLAAADPRRAEGLRDLQTQQDRLLAQADTVVGLYNRVAEGRITFAVMWQVIGGILAGLMGLGISWIISTQIADPLAACAEAAQEIAKGNLRLDPQRVTSADEVGVLQDAFNHMLTSLREIALQSRQVSESLSMAAAQILASTQEQAAGTKQQAAAVQEITTTVEQINLSSKQVAERARQVAGTADAVAASGTAGLQAVRDAAVGMDAIREQTETVADNIITLSERTQAVGEIIATVNEIAEQSNLVALNAAIEAADAREQGRRFSVVAGEIKNLADQAKEATAQVRGILEQTQKGINTSVMLTEEALKRVETGHERTSVSEQVIRQMSDNIQESVHAFQQIVGATNQQQIGLEQVTQALHEIRQASQQTAATTSQLERASIELTQLGSQLSKTLEKYRL